MIKLPKPISTGQPNPDILTGEATVTSLAKEVIELKKELKDQRNENKHFIYWIIGGVVAIVAVVAIEIMLFHTRTDKDTLDLQNQYFQEVKNLQQKNFELELRVQKEIDSIKVPIIQNSPIK